MFLFSFNYLKFYKYIKLFIRLVCIIVYSLWNKRSIIWSFSSQDWHGGSNSPAKLRKGKPRDSVPCRNTSLRHGRVEGQRGKVTSTGLKIQMRTPACCASGSLSWLSSAERNAGKVAKHISKELSLDLCSSLTRAQCVAVSGAGCWLGAHIPGVAAGASTMSASQSLSELPWGEGCVPIAYLALWHRW